jgi:predicted SnoaL-like aldol condensation-catalyzing enzyme
MLDFVRAGAIRTVIAVFVIGTVSCSGSSSPMLPAANRDRAVAALKAIFEDKDTTAIDTYFEPSFIRHDPSAKADGTAAFKAQIEGQLGNVSWRHYRALEQDDLVVVHDEYDNYPAAGDHSISFDLFRFSGGKIGEHWTCLQRDPGTYVSGHSMVDGPTAIDANADTQSSADTVVTPGKGFVPVVIIAGDFMKLKDYLEPTFVQHDPLIADGIMGLGAGFSQPPLNTLRDFAIPESLAEHDFVFTRSKGTMTWDSAKPNSPNNPTVYCDLFHVVQGKISEHWDVIELDPNSTDIMSVKDNAAGHTLWD